LFNLSFRLFAEWLHQPANDSSDFWLNKAPN
jgi:hypothetical protein